MTISILNKINKMNKYAITGNLIVGALGLTAVANSIQLFCNVPFFQNANVDDDKLYDVLNLDDYECEKKVYYRNKNQPTDIRFTYYDPKTEERIGYIDFTPQTGQIGFWGIHEDYRHKTLGKQMIEKIIPECKKHYTNKIYGYTDSEEIRKESINNPKIKRIDRSPNWDYYEMDI